MQISKRLKAVSEMVTPGSRLADVGTDHAYVPIYLAEAGTIPLAIAMDVNRGPLLRAQENIRQHGLEEKIETRLSDGLEALQSQEADTVLIAGMGGLLTVRILKNGKEVLGGCRELILQPQSDIRSVRAYLKAEGYVITDENMVLEDGKYYPMMHAEKCAGSIDAVIEKNEFSRKTDETLKMEAESLVSGDETKHALRQELDLRYGPILLERKHPLLQGYLDRERELAQKVQASLQGKDTDAAQKRRDEIEKELELLRQAELILQQV